MNCHALIYPFVDLEFEREKMMKKQVGLEDKWKIGEVCCVLLHFDVKMMSACRPFFLLCSKDNLIKKLTIICPILLKISLAI